MPLVTIDDPADARLDDYRNIPDGELIARRGIFVAEGRLVVRRLLTDSPLTARSVMVTDVARASLADVLAARPNLPVYVVPQAVVNGITGVNIHRGCLAIGERPAALRWQQVARDAVRVVVLERVTNADNVGGVFRNAAAFGATAVLLDPVSIDPLYRKAIRTSMGAVLRVPFARMPRWPEGLIELRERGFTTVGLTPNPPAPPIEPGGRGLAGARLALVVGHEGEGLTSGALDACEYRLRIPMASGVDSLNVATAAAIALYAFCIPDV